ncbi:hypothetical protein IB278_24340 [Variovorax sp. VRV01]|uniref:hypothetical protein n=1 Tax=Variovorax sp. VRV01 TaxID=2769259 RepID=UPI0017827900|nr:hypothetical protein [Variovorax sp. VRV01]MBD9667112.1 hypothetical protein [Variovorax sp. VRV01]
MNEIPAEEVSRCLARLAQGDKLPLLLRELGQRYGATKSALGFFVTDLVSEGPLEAAQAVWTWDAASVGKGLSDDDLVAELNFLKVRFRES